MDINTFPHLFMIIVPCILELDVLQKYRQTILNLALVSRSAMEITEPYISKFEFWVKSKKRGPVALKYYKPRILSDIAYLPAPLQLTHLAFSEKFSENLKSPYQLPPSLTHLKFGNGFNGEIANGVLPNGLITLGFGDKFNHPLPAALPSALKHLWFGTDFNVPLPVLPQGLTHLSFGLQPHIFLWGWQDEVIVDLITSTFFAVQPEDKFNQPLENKIPSSLTHLALGTCYNHPFNPPKACNITFLRIGDSFAHPIPLRRLPKLTKLVLGWQSSHRFLRPDKMPAKLTNLVSFLPTRELRNLHSLTSLSASFSYDDPNHFPSHLKYGYFLNHFRFYSDVSSYLRFLPTLPVMTHLVLHIQGIHLTLDKSNLPPNITHLHILLWSGALEKASITSPTLLQLSLPKTVQIELHTPRLTHISFTKIKKLPALPPTTTHVAFGPLQKKLPSIKKRGSHPLPNTITHLKFGPNTTTLPQLPKNLTHLTLTSQITPINTSNLPSNLVMLRLPRAGLKHIRLPLPAGLKFEETTVKNEGYEWRPVMFATDWL